MYRNVRGSDFLVYCNGTSVEEVKVTTRLTRGDVVVMFGAGPVFIRNKNVMKLKSNNLRGVIIYIEGSVCIVWKANGNEVQYLRLLPSRMAKLESRPTQTTVGYLLQQVSGPHLLDPKNKLTNREYRHPAIHVDEFLRMSVKGPDVYSRLPHFVNDLPPIRCISFTTNKVRNRERKEKTAVNTVPVAFVVDRGQDVRLRSMCGCYMIPLFSGREARRVSAERERYVIKKFARVSKEELLGFIKKGTFTKAEIVKLSEEFEKSKGKQLVSTALRV